MSHSVDDVYVGVCAVVESCGIADQTCPLAAACVIQTNRSGTKCFLHFLVRIELLAMQFYTSEQ